MYKHHKHLFQNSAILHTYTGFHKLVRFYDAKTNVGIQHDTAIYYDGDTFHVLIHSETFREIFKNNDMTMHHLADILWFRHSFAYSLKYVLRILLLAFILYGPFQYFVGVLLTDRILVVQESIIETMNLMGFLFIAIAICCSLIGSVYNDSRYRRVMPAVLREMNRQHNDGFGYHESSSSLYVPHLVKTSILYLLLFAFVGLYYYLSYSPFVTNSDYSDYSVSQQLDVIHSMIEPQIVQTSYVLNSSQTIDLNDDDFIMHFNDYYYQQLTPGLDFRLYDASFQVEFDSTTVESEFQYAAFVDVDGPYVLLHYVPETQPTYAIYNYETNEEVLRFEVREVIDHYVNGMIFMVETFAYIDDQFYIGVYGYSIFDEYDYNEFYVLKAYSDGLGEYVISEPIINGDFGKIMDFEIHNDMLYFIIQGEMNATIVRYNLIDQQIQYDNMGIPEISNIEIINDEIYLQLNFQDGQVLRYSPYVLVYLIHGPESLLHDAQGDNVFLIGSTYDEFREYDQNGTILNYSIVCQECDSEEVLFSVENDTLYAFETDTHILRTFLKDEVHKFFYASPDSSNDFYHYFDITPMEFYSIIYYGFWVLCAIPIMRLSYLLHRRYRYDQFFLNIEYRS